MMRRSEKKYSSEYMINPSASRFADDSVIYIGKWYYFVSDKKTVSKSKKILFVFSVIEALLFAAGAFADTTASFTPYAFFPFIILFLPIVFNVGACFSVLSFDTKITHKQYDKKILVQKAYSSAAIIFGVLSLVGDIIMYFMKSDISFGKDIIFTVCVILIIISSVVSLKIQKNLLCSCDC